MIPAIAPDPAALAASAAHWWTLAGVDIAVQEEAHDWLRRIRAPMPLTEAGVPPDTPALADTVSPAQPAPARSRDVAMPDDLDGFAAWLTSDPAQPEARFGNRRIAPRLMLQPSVLVLVDMPTPDDMVADALFSSGDATLLAAMMRAVGRGMERIATASLLLARPPGGIMDDALVAQALPRLAKLVQLTRPEAILLLGDGVGRAFMSANDGLTSLSSLAINLDDGTIPVLSLPAPFVLLKHPERKAAAWVALRQWARR